MSIDQTILDGLLTQLNMAQAKHPVSTIQVAILKAQIRELRAKIEDEHVPVEPLEVYSPHMIVIGAGA